MTSKRVAIGPIGLKSVPPPSIDTSIKAIKAIEKKFNELKPVLYKKEQHQQASQALKQFHELQAQISAIYDAPTLSPDEEVPAKDLLNSILQLERALKVSGSSAIMTREEIAAKRAESETKAQEILALEKKQSRSASNKKSSSTKKSASTKSSATKRTTRSSTASDLEAAKALQTQLKKGALKGSAEKTSRGRKRKSLSDDENDAEGESADDMESKSKKVEPKPVPIVMDVDPNDPFAFPASSPVKALPKSSSILSQPKTKPAPSSYTRRRLDLNGASSTTPSRQTTSSSSSSSSARSAPTTTPTSPIPTSSSPSPSPSKKRKVEDVNNKKSTPVKPTTPGRATRSRA